LCKLNLVMWGPVRTPSAFWWLTTRNPFQMHLKQSPFSPIAFTASSSGPVLCAPEVKTFVWANHSFTQDDFFTWHQSEPGRQSVPLHPIQN
jgi:hypothetical protein